MKIKLTKIKNLIKDKINSLKKEKLHENKNCNGTSNSITINEEIGADQPRGGGGGGFGWDYGGGGGVGGVGEIVCSDIFLVDTYKCSCGKKIDFTYSIREQSKQD
jgi:hypothetical protein